MLFIWDKTAEGFPRITQLPKKPVIAIEMAIGILKKMAPSIRKKPNRASSKPVIHSAQEYH